MLKSWHLRRRAADAAAPAPLALVRHSKRLAVLITALSAGLTIGTTPAFAAGNIDASTNADLAAKAIDDCQRHLENEKIAPQWTNGCKFQFVPTSYTEQNGAYEKVSQVLSNYSYVNNASTSLWYEQTTGQSTTLKVTTTLSGSLFKTVNVSVAAEYSKTVHTSRTVKDVYTMNIAPRCQGWFERSPAMGKIKGTVKLEFETDTKIGGNHHKHWYITNVEFSAPSDGPGVLAAKYASLDGASASTC